MTDPLIERDPKPFAALQRMSLVINYNAADPNNHAHGSVKSSYKPAIHSFIHSVSHRLASHSAQMQLSSSWAWKFSATPPPQRRATATRVSVIQSRRKVQC